MQLTIILYIFFICIYLKLDQIIDLSSLRGWPFLSFSPLKGSTVTNTHLVQGLMFLKQDISLLYPYSSVAIGQDILNPSIPPEQVKNKPTFALEAQLQLVRFGSSLFYPFSGVKMRASGPWERDHHMVVMYFVLLP